MINIGLIEDQILTRDHYRDYFRKSSSFNCILAVESIEKFLYYFRKEQHFDIVLIDIGLPGMSGIEGLSILRKIIPDANLVIFTTHQDNDKIFKALRAGANGYLLKTLTEIEVGERLEAISMGEAAISPPIARRLIEYFNPPKRILTSSNDLTLSDKENRVVNLLVDGFSYKRISEEVSISVNGVRYHIKNIYKKLHVNSKIEIMKKIESGNLKLIYGDNNKDS